MGDDKAMDAARRKLQQMGGEGGEESADFRKWKMGKNHVRVLPRPGHDLWYLETWGHYLGGSFVRCRNKVWTGKNGNVPAIGTDCPLCAQYLKEVTRVNRQFERGTDKAKAAWRKVNEEWGPRAGYSMIQYDPTEEEPEVMPARFGSQVLHGLLTEYVDGGVNFASPKNGRTMIVKKAQKKNTTDPKNVEYTIIRGAKREDITEIWNEIKNSLPDLEELAGRILKREELQRLVEAYTVDFDKEEDEDEDRSRGKKVGAGRRRSEEDEDDESDSDDEDDSEDD